MNVKHHLKQTCALLLVLTFSGCGANMFSSSKVIDDPFSLQGTAIASTGNVTVNGLTTRIAADSTTSFQKGNLVGSGDGMAPYRDMRKIEISQMVGMSIELSGTPNPPATIVLRNVDLRLIIRAHDGVGEVQRSSPPVEVRHTGTVTLSRQADNTYTADSLFTSQNEYLNPQAQNLLSILVDGSENNVEVSVSFTGDTSSSSIPDGSSVVLKLRLEGGRAVVRW